MVILDLRSIDGIIGGGLIARVWLGVYELQADNTYCNNKLNNISCLISSGKFVMKDDRLRCYGALEHDGWMTTLSLHRLTLYNYKLNKYETSYRYYLLTQNGNILRIHPKDVTSVWFLSLFQPKQIQNINDIKLFSNCYTMSNYQFYQKYDLSFLNLCHYTLNININHLQMITGYQQIIQQNQIIYLQNNQTNTMIVSVNRRNIPKGKVNKKHKIKESVSFFFVCFFLVVFSTQNGRYVFQHKT